MQEKQEECEIIHFSHFFFVNLPKETTKSKITTVTEYRVTL